MKAIKHSKNLKKPKTAPKLKRYKCAVCKKRTNEQVMSAPYYCPSCKKSCWWLAGKE